MHELQAAFDWRALPWAMLWRVMSGRATPEEVRVFGDRELAVGALACWVVGIGRCWDDPRAQFLQRLGLGSVAYPFVLGALLWLLFWPWRIPHWRYKALVAYIALCAPPAILYAVPVEMFLSRDSALIYNSAALAIVAFWRVALLHRYFRVGAGLGGFTALVATVLPVAAIVIGMAMINVSTGVFAAMGGFRGDPRDAFAANIGMLAAILLFYPFLGGSLFYFGYTIKVWCWPEGKSGPAPVPP